MTTSIGPVPGHVDDDYDVDDRTTTVEGATGSTTNERLPVLPDLLDLNAVSDALLSASSLDGAQAPQVHLTQAIASLFDDVVSRLWTLQDCAALMHRCDQRVADMEREVQDTRQYVVELEAVVAERDQQELYMTAQIDRRNALLCDQRRQYYDQVLALKALIAQYDKDRVLDSRQLHGVSLATYPADYKPDLKRKGSRIRFDGDGRLEAAEWNRLLQEANAKLVHRGKTFDMQVQLLNDDLDSSRAECLKQAELADRLHRQVKEMREQMKSLKEEKGLSADEHQVEVHALRARIASLEQRLDNSLSASSVSRALVAGEEGLRSQIAALHQTIDQLKAEHQREVNALKSAFEAEKTEWQKTEEVLADSFSTHLLTSEEEIARRARQLASIEAQNRRRRRSSRRAVSGEVTATETPKNRKTMSDFSLLPDTMIGAMRTEFHVANKGGPGMDPKGDGAPFITAVQVSGQAQPEHVQVLAGKDLLPPFAGDDGAPPQHEPGWRSEQTRRAGVVTATKHQARSPEPQRGQRRPHRRSLSSSELLRAGGAVLVASALRSGYKAARPDQHATAQTEERVVAGNDTVAGAGGRKDITTRQKTDAADDNDDQAAFQLPARDDFDAFHDDSSSMASSAGAEPEEDDVLDGGAPGGRPAPRAGVTTTSGDENEAEEEYDDEYDDVVASEDDDDMVDEVELQLERAWRCVMDNSRGVQCDLLRGSAEHADDDDDQAYQGWPMARDRAYRNWMAFTEFLLLQHEQIAIGARRRKVDGDDGGVDDEGSTGSHRIAHQQGHRVDHHLGSDKHPPSDTGRSPRLGRSEFRDKPGNVHIYFDADADRPVRRRLAAPKLPGGPR